MQHETITVTPPTLPPSLPPSLPPFHRSDYFRALFRKGGMKESEEGVMVVESYK